MNNAVGVADVPAMLRAGMPVLLGNDGFSNDMFTEMKTAYLRKKQGMAQRSARMPGNQVIDMAYRHNAALARQYFPQPLGELNPSAAADLDPAGSPRITPCPPTTCLAYPVRRQRQSRDTHHGRGQVASRCDRQLLTLDEAAIAAASRRSAAATWERFWELG